MSLSEFDKELLVECLADGWGVEDVATEYQLDVAELRAQVEEWRAQDQLDGLIGGWI